KGNLSFILNFPNGLRHFFVAKCEVDRSLQEGLGYASRTRDGTDAQGLWPDDGAVLLPSSGSPASPADIHLAGIRHCSGFPGAPWLHRLLEGKTRRPVALCHLHAS